jgi:hypothetical protein
MVFRKKLFKYKGSIVAIFDLYSKRQKQNSGQVPDVYIYDDFPKSLRVQIVHIWTDLLGDETEYQDSYLGVKNGYKFIVETLRREYGVFELIAPSNYGGQTYLKELCDFILNETDIERCIDSVELSFKFGDVLCRKYEYRHIHNASKQVDKHIDELNKRFKEHGIGYEFNEGEIIRIDSQLIHSEAVKPALLLLNRTGFEGPRDEFLSAYDHYRAYA